MVIDNLHIIRTAVAPAEADAPLVVYANAVLAGAIALKRPQAGCLAAHADLKPGRGVEDEQLATSHALDGDEPPYAMPSVQPLRVAVGKASDHLPLMLRREAYSVNRNGHHSTGRASDAAQERIMMHS